MNPRITLEDMTHLRTFPDVQRAVLMEKIRSRHPAKTMALNGTNDFGKSVLKLRRDGFGLIDLQPEETTLATVWYRRRPVLLKHTGADVAMLRWEAWERGGATTLMTWRI